MGPHLAVYQFRKALGSCITRACTPTEKSKGALAECLAISLTVPFWTVLLLLCLTDITNCDKNFTSV